MNAVQSGLEVCAVCGKSTAEGHFMRLYLECGSLDFCTPVCAQGFNRDPTRFGVPARNSDARDWTDGDAPWRWT
jgi:hypothetical protein